MMTTRGSLGRRGTGLELFSLGIAAALALSCGQDGAAAAAADGPAASATIVKPQADIDAAWAQAQTIASDMYASNKTAAYGMFHSVAVSTNWWDWSQDSLSYMNGVVPSTSDFESRLGIRELRLMDGPVTCGAYQQGCTIFPAPIAVASTWDVDQAVAMYAAQGAEKKAKGANVSLSPTMNIVRDPRGGRNFETFSEDPYLTAQLAASAVTGIQSNHVIATSKHYIDNDQETNRNTVIVSVDERTQHEIYLPPFQAAIQAGTGSVMCSYNRIATSSGANDYGCENSHTLKDLLKGELGFRGFVMSDWNATHSGAKAANNGLDMEMNTTTYFGNLNGQISDSTAQDMLRRIVFAHLITGLNASPATKITKAQGVQTKVVSTSSNQQLAQDTAEQSIVLLKNSGVLPLSKTATNVAVFGECADSKFVYQGGGSASGDVTGKTIVTPRQAIANALGVSSSSLAYGTESNLGSVASLAAGKSAAIVVLCQMSQEDKDRGSITFGATNSNSNANSDSLVTQVAATGTPTIVMTIGPAQVGMPWASNANVKAILWAGLLGEKEGPAIARVLFGDVNPSGKLPVTFASLSDFPTNSSVYGSTSDMFPGGSTIYYREGLNVGYRHFDARSITPLFPFGHGLSYTTFGYSNLAVTPSVNAAVSGTATLELDLTNTGARAGAEVVQVYVGFPATAGEPPKVLKGFKKVSLAAGAMQHVSITLGPDAYQVWSNGWSAVMGTYQVMVGSSSRDIRLTGSFVVNTSSKTMWPLTVTKVAAGAGTVTSIPSGIACGATCSATFESGTVVTLSAAAASGSLFTGWTGACTGAAATCTLTMSAAQTVGAVFNPVQTTNTLSVTKAGTGSGGVVSNFSAIDCGTTCSAAIASDVVVTLTATAGASSTFAGWSGACSGTAATCVLDMSAPRAVTATFALVSTGYPLTVTKVGTGTGTVTSNVGGISCGATCSASLASGTVVTLTAAADAGSSFSGWSGACTGTASTCAVTMTAAQSATAGFTSSQGNGISINAGGAASGTFVADVDYTGGTAYSTTKTIDTTQLTGTVPPQAVLQSERYGSFTYTIPGLTAGSPYSVTLYFAEVYFTAAGQRLFGVSINGTSVLSAFDIFTAAGGASKAIARTFSATANSSGQVVITFAPGTANNPKVDGITVAAGNPVLNPVLTVTKTGSASSSVVSAPAGISCGTACSASFAPGTMVTLTAVPNTSQGAQFMSWSGACTGSALSCVVTLAQSASVTATFQEVVALTTLSVAKGGTGTGTVASSPAGIACGATCSATFAVGTSVTLTAAAGASTTFAGWSGACTGTAPTCAVAIAAPTSVTVTFTAIIPENPTLTVTKAGTGTGTVTSSPSGISCGTSCGTAFAPNSVVTLSASADTGSTFTGWSGACSGTAATCAVTMSTLQSVTATFTANTTTTPCANPVTFTSNTGNFNTTGAACFRTSLTVNGWGCSNLTGRTVSVNGGTATATCGAGPFPIPKWSDGYTYFSVTAGSYPWASIYLW